MVVGEGDLAGFVVGPLLPYDIRPNFPSASQPAAVQRRPTRLSYFTAQKPECAKWNVARRSTNCFIGPPGVGM